MGRVSFVEVLDRRGAVRERLRIGNLPLTIGRSYANDLILDDRHVSPEHARLETDPDGGVRLVDLGSRNGVFLLGPTRAVRSTPLESGMRVRLGRSELRFRSADHPVEPTLPLAPTPRPVEWLTSRWSAGLLLLAVLFLTLVVRQYRSSYHEFEWLGAASENALALLVVALWAGGWALATRFLVGRARFLAHWAVACVAVLATLAWEDALTTARFLFAGIEPVEVTEFGGEFVIAVLLLFGHLGVARVLQPLRRALVSVFVCLAVMVPMKLADLANQPDWVSTLPYWSRLEPIPPSWLRTRSLDEYFGEAAVMRYDLDLMVDEIDERG